MSRAVLTGALLDFGRSLWESPDDLLKVAPGLAGKGFQPTGRFGIGFFSVFMWAEEVQVFTRDFRASEDSTYVLQFRGGLQARPLLRMAEPNERLPLGGTTVRLRLRKPIAEFMAEAQEPSEHGQERTHQWPDADLHAVVRALGALCPSLTVDLVASVNSSKAQVLTGGDWTRIPNADLVDRLESRGILFSGSRGYVARLDEVRTSGGEIVARAALGGDVTTAGVLTDGGFVVTSVDGLPGLWIGRSDNTARTDGAIQATQDEIADWATRQAVLCAQHVGSWDQPKYAALVASLGGDVGNLHVCETSDGVLTLEELQEWADEREVVYVGAAADAIDNAIEGVLERKGNEYSPTSGLAEDVVSYIPPRWSFHTAKVDPTDETRIKSLIIGALREAWNGSVNIIEGREAVVGFVEDDEVEASCTRIDRDSSPSNPGG